MGKVYRHPALKQLKDQQTRYAPRDRRIEQVEKAELLLGEIEGAKRYPYEYLCYRITSIRKVAFALSPRKQLGRAAAADMGAYRVSLIFKREMKAHLTHLVSPHTPPGLPTPGWRSPQPGSAAQNTH